MYYDEFKNMVEYHAEGKSFSGRYKIQHVEAREFSELGKLQNPEYAGQLDQNVCVLKDTELQEIVMSDSWMEQATNIEFVRKAKGDVLIAGFGLGMVVLAIQNKPEVTSITVVEINQELVDFIKPNLPLNDKVKIIVSDIHDYEPTIIFDTVYCDIWNHISGDNYDEMNNLSEKFFEASTGGVYHWRYERTDELHDEEEYYGCY